MISFRALSTASLLGLLVTLAGCSAETGTASGADSAETANAKDSVALEGSSDEARAAHGPRGRHAGGPDFLLVAALHAPINLTAEQKTTIQGALAQSAPKAASSFDRGRATALAASIRAGKIDATSQPGPSADDMAARMAERQASSAKALATLHATLTPEQRSALVEAISKKGAEHGMKGHAKDGERRERPEHAAGQRPGPMGGMLAGLEVTKAQEEAIRAKLDAQRSATKPTEADREGMKAKHEAFRTQMKARLQTFASDSFDATAFVTPPEGAFKGGPAARPEGMANPLAVVVSVLEPAQREKLAARIEAGPAARGEKRVHRANVDQGGSAR